MFFCCGKLNKEAPGCKFDRHHPIKENEDDDEFADQFK
jgi:hypothetical protein